MTPPAPDTANISSDKPNVSPKQDEAKPEKAIDTHTNQEIPAKPTSPPTKISQISLQPSTPAAPTAAELKSSLELLQKAIGLQTIYVNLFGERYQLASQHLKLAIQWYDQLRTKFVQRQLQEKQETINKAKTTLASMQDALKFQQSELPNKVARLETTQMTAEVLGDLLEKAALDKDTAAIEIENLKLESQNAQASLDTQQKNLEEQRKKLETLQKTALPDPAQMEVQNQIIAGQTQELKWQEQHLELDKQNLDILKQRLEQTDKQLQLASEWHQKLQSVYQTRQQQFLEIQVQQEQQRHFTNALGLRKQLEELPATAPATQRELIKLQLQEAKERAEQVKRNLQVNHLEEQLQQWHTTSQQKIADAGVYDTLETLRNLLIKVDQLFPELQQLEDALKGKLQIFDQQLEVTQKKADTLANEALQHDTQSQQVLTSLTSSLRGELNKIPTLRTKGEELKKQLENAYKDNLHRALFRVRQLPKEVGEWQIVFEEGLKPLPGLFFQQGQLTWQALVQAFQSTTSQTWLLFSIATCIWLLLLAAGLRWEKRSEMTLNEAKNRSFIAYASLLGLRLLEKNALGIAMLGLVILLFWLTKPSWSSTFFVFAFLLSGLIIKLVINAIQLLLAEDTVKSSGRVLSWRLYGMVMLLGTLGLFTALLHIETEGYVIRVPLTTLDIIDSLFMLGLSATVLPLLQLRKTLLSAWRSRGQSSGGFLFSLLTWLVPWLILAVSLLGLIGYINLGWNMAKHLSLFLLVLVLWLMVEGLATDMMNWWKRLATQSYSHSTLWTDSLIPLVHKILGLILTVLAVLAFSWLNGWYSDVAVRQTFSVFFGYPLLALGDQQIVVGDIFLSVFILWIVFWLGGWSRQVSYQWVYLNITDTGIRHSLSIFTQYAVIVIGLLIALNIIGIDITTLTVFAGAVGVGVGFGLQNVINNFVSGVLLLVERPLRSGDIVNVKSHQGKVTEIGIRSLTIETVEGPEIIVPNAEVISNIFTNFTRNHQYQRKTLYVNVSPTDDLKLAYDLLKGVLEEEPEILKQPASNVYLAEFTDYSVKFRLDYFVDIRQSNSVRIASNLQMKIWERFNLAGLHIAFFSLKEESEAGKQSAEEAQKRNGLKMQSQPQAVAVMLALKRFKGRK